MQQAQKDTFYNLENQTVIVGGQKVGPNWLKGKDIDQYRKFLHTAFESAQCQYKIRNNKVILNIFVEPILQDKGNKEEIKKKILALQPPDIIQTYNERYGNQYKVCHPEMSDLHDRKKLVKMSRSCTHKYLERFFEIDSGDEGFKYYQKDTSTKPKKVVTLEDVRVTVETFEDQDEKGKKTWTNENAQYRLSIMLKSRKYLPVFYYTDTLHDAKCTKVNLASLLIDHTALKNAISTVSNIFKTNGINKTIDFFRHLKQKWSLLKTTYECIDQIKYKYEVDQKDFIKLWNAQLQSKEAIPRIWSTFRYGSIKVPEVEQIRTYSMMNRGLDKMVKFFKLRRRQRNPSIRDMLRNKIRQKQFSCMSMNYTVHSSVLENMHKLGDIPYAINDMNGKSIRIEGENLIMIDSKGYQFILLSNPFIDHEFLIPVNEICFMASDFGFREADSKEALWRLQLRGRKINNNTSDQENILAQQLGLERNKHSRLNMKGVFRVSLKNLFIPTAIKNQLQSSIVNQADRIMYKIKFDIGEFYCYTHIFPMDAKSNQIELTDNLVLELNDAKYIKMTLIAIKGREKPYKQHVNEFVSEREVAWVNLKLRDFEDLVINKDIVHKIAFNGVYYNPNDQSLKDSKNHVIVTAAFIIDSINGAAPATLLEGPQMLIGKHVLYQKKFIAQVLKLNRDKTCQIKLIDTQPGIQKFPAKIIENVSISESITRIEKYGISCLNPSTPPQNYSYGQYEWNLDIALTRNDGELVTKIQQAIQNSQAKALFNQKFNIVRGNKNTSFVCGKIILSLMDAQFLQNSSNVPCNTVVQFSVQDKHSSNAKFMDIAIEQSFIQCKKNSEIMTNKTVNSTLIKGNNNPSWVTDKNPQGECYDLGMYMKKFPHYILIEVYHQKSQKDKELLGYAELHTEDLISLEDYGQEFYLFLEDSINRSSIIKLRSLFVPSPGTIDRLNLDPETSVFKNAQQFMFYKILHMYEAYDIFGYKVTLGKYMPGSEKDNTQLTPGVDANILQKRYDQFSPEHKRHIQLKEQNPLRPKYEENVHVFRQLWLYTQFENRKKALSARQTLFWEQYMGELMETPLEEGLIEDELRSIRSKLTNTTKMISSKYRKRSRQFQTKGEGEEKALDKKGNKFSVIFVGQWEKDLSWKYVDIWYLVKYGMPHDLRVSLWKDLLRRQVNEQYEIVFFKKYMPYKETYNSNVSIYENLKAFANSRDSMFYLQIEEDVKEFKFPEGYQAKGQKENRLEEERFSMQQIFKTYDLWAHEFSKRRHKIVVYNKGMLAIVQRMLSLMAEEDAFWTLVGMVKAFNNVYSFDFKQENQDQLAHYSPYLTRRAFKNEMTILNCTIKIHYPHIFDKLKSLGMPIEWYFYEEFTQFFSYSFTSELVLRLWDMIVLNLSTNQIDNRKRALWYLLAVPLYMIQMSQQQILTAATPTEVKELLYLRTSSLNYDPSLFIDELLNIIREVYVRKDTMINKLFKFDKPNQLENMRRELELDSLKKFEQELQNNSLINTHIHQHGISVELNNKVQSYPYANEFEVIIEVIGFRNLFLPQLDQEEVSLQLSIQGDETIQSKFETNVPNDNDIAKQQRLKNKIILRTFVQQSKTLQIKLVQIKQGIHQVNQSLGELDLNQYKTYIQEHASLKLIGSKDTQNAYIDLVVQLLPKTQNQIFIPVQGFTFQSHDPYYLEKDEETKKQIKKSDIVQKTQDQVQKNKLKGDLLEYLRLFNADETIIQEIIKDKQDQAKKLHILQNLVSVIPTMIKDLRLTDSKELTNLIIKMVIMGMQETTEDIFGALFKIFSNTQLLTVSDFGKIVDHIYFILLYQVPTNESFKLSYYLLNHGFSTNVVKVQQQSIAGGGEGNLLKLFSNTNEVQTYSATTAFQASLNQVIRLSGLIKEIDMTLQPFNNINFWLKSENNLKKQQHYLLVSIQDNNGDLVQYKFKFNSSGMFEPTPNFESVLPLRVGGSHAISQTEFVAAMKQVPLVEDCIRYDKFLQSQLAGTEDVYVDANENHQVTFVSVGRIFRFNFSSRIDKENDFTVDSSQLMRIAKSNPSYLYSKSKQADSETIDLNLSSLSKQDTFIRIKQRMKLILDYIAQAENIRDVPNIMSEKFQFKKGSDQVYNSLDRLMNVSRDTQFELIRVKQNEDNTPVKFDSYALYQHANDSIQWRPCRVIMKINQRGKSDQFKIEYQHEPNNIYVRNREDVLLSLEYKRFQEGYDKEEVKEFLDKLDKEEVIIAKILKEHDKKGLQVGDMQDIDGSLKIKHSNLDDDKDEEQRHINAVMEQDFLNDQ